LNFGVIFETISYETAMKRFQGKLMDLTTTLNMALIGLKRGHSHRGQAICEWEQFSASLLIEVMRDKSIFTSSSVAIKRNVLLTAAHSVEDIEEGYVHLSYSYQSKTQKIKFKKVIIHNDYDKHKSNFKNDIALIILEKNLPEEIRPVSIGDLNFSPTLNRIGFGERNGLNNRTWTNPVFKDLEEDKKTVILNDQLSVIGDSGGPLIDSQNQLIGIHSTLEGNSKTYAVFVPAYKDWIHHHLPLRSVD
jgi:V8-like Glu-specific endopeptidase